MTSQPPSKVVGRVFWPVTLAVAAVVVLIVVAAFGVLSSPWALLALPLSFLSGLMFSSIALFFTSVAPAVYSFNYYFTLFITPMFFFSGVFFPLSSFHEIVQNLSWILPLTPVVHLTRALFGGELQSNLLLALALIIVFTVLFFSISLFTMRRRLTI